MQILRFFEFLITHHDTKIRIEASKAVERFFTCSNKVLNWIFSTKFLSLIEETIKSDDFEVKIS